MPRCLQPGGHQTLRTEQMPTELPARTRPFRAPTARAPMSARYPAGRRRPAAVKARAAPTCGLAACRPTCSPGCGSTSLSRTGPQRLRSRQRRCRPEGRPAGLPVTRQCSLALWTSAARKAAASRFAPARHFAGGQLHCPRQQLLREVEPRLLGVDRLQARHVALLGLGEQGVRVIDRLRHFGQPLVERGRLGRCDGERGEDAATAQCGAWCLPCAGWLPL